MVFINNTDVQKHKDHHVEITIPAESVLLVTGAAGGMGRACALLAAEHEIPLLLADLNSSALEQVAEECRRTGSTTRCQSFDITDRDAVESLTVELTSNVAIGGIIHTIGLSPQMAEWQRILDVDFVSSVAFLESLRPLLVPGGAAVCIASMSAYLVPPDEILEKLIFDAALRDSKTTFTDVIAHQPAMTDSGMAYAWAKRALRNWALQAAAAWGQEGKRLVSLSPGLIDTDMGQLENAALDASRLEAMKQGIAVSRLGTAEDIAASALFLVSQKAAYITGCDLLVDGGFVAGHLQATRQ